MASKAGKGVYREKMTKESKELIERSWRRANSQQVLTVCKEGEQGKVIGLGDGEEARKARERDKERKEEKEKRRKERAKMRSREVGPRTVTPAKTTTATMHNYTIKGAKRPRTQP